MHVAGPIQDPDEAHALEQVAYLTELRRRLTHPSKPPGLATRRTVKDPFAY